MLKDYRFLLLAAVAVVIALSFLGTSEKEKILRRLEALRTEGEIREPESGIQQLVKAHNIGEYFREQTTFDLTNAGYRLINIDSRQELVQRIARGRARLALLELAIDDPRVVVEGDMAEVEFQGSALGTFRDEPQQFLDIHRISVMLEKSGGVWLVTGGRHIRDERRSSEE